MSVNDLQVVDPSPNTPLTAAEADQALRAWSEKASSAFSKNTQRAWASDWALFTGFCRDHHRQALPSSPNTVSAFLRFSADNRKVATLKRYAASIARAHQAIDLINPVHSETVRLTLRSLANAKGTKQKQARGLLWKDLEIYLQIQPTQWRDHRDRALVMVAYEAMLRREEVVALNVEDVVIDSGDSSATVFIAQSKTDQTRAGQTQWISPLTWRLVQTWCEHAHLKEGALFRRVMGKKKIGHRLTPAAVTTIFQRLGLWLGWSSTEYEQLSGHSARVGATQDLVAMNQALPAVMQSGRWKDTRMPARYAEKLLAKLGAMAQVAKTQGRCD